MNEFSLFYGISDEDKKRMLECFSAKTVSFKKDGIILSNISRLSIIGVVNSGKACLIRYDYSGSRTIIEEFSEGNVFGNIFNPINDEVSVVALTDCEVNLIEYDAIIKRCHNNCECHYMITNNLLKILSSKITNSNERIGVLTKRSIRDKLLGYFQMMSKQKASKTFKIPFSFTELADYLAIDRSAMTREIKNLKDENFIEVKAKRITLLY